MKKFLLALSLSCLISCDQGSQSEDISPVDPMKKQDGRGSMTQRRIHPVAAQFKALCIALDTSTIRRNELLRMLAVVEEQSVHFEGQDIALQPIELAVEDDNEAVAACFSLEKGRPREDVLTVVLSAKGEATALRMYRADLHFESEWPAGDRAEFLREYLESVFKRLQRPATF